MRLPDRLQGRWRSGFGLAHIDSAGFDHQPNMLLDQGGRLRILEKRQIRVLMHIEGRASMHISTGFGAHRNGFRCIVARVSVHRYGFRCIASTGYDAPA